MQPGRVLACVAMAALLSACSADSPDSADYSADKYTQTWPSDYSSTTCKEWNEAMTEGQQFAGAADMLTGARNKGDGGTGLPPDSLISQFQSGVTTACVIPTMSLAEVGAGLYSTERSRFRP